MGSLDLTGPEVRPLNPIFPGCRPELLQRQLFPIFLLVSCAIAGLRKRGKNLILQCDINDDRLFMRLKTLDVFIKDLVDQFPEIMEEVLDEDYIGILTLQIGCFKRFTQKAIDLGDLETIKKCFNFVEENISVVEFKIENALFISYLDKLNFRGSSQIENLLPQTLAKVLSELKIYYNREA